jgi:putative drug exporter of the RND superfamily
MFFSWFGSWVTHRWPVWLAVWVVALAGAGMLAPPLDDVVTTGEFAFLPVDSSSRVAERLFQHSFPRQATASTVAVIVRRTDRSEGLTDADLLFVDAGAAPELNSGEASTETSSATRPIDLKTRLDQLVAAHDLTPTVPPPTSTMPAAAASTAVSPDTKDESEAEESTSHVVTFRDRTSGQFLLSEDRQATLMLIELPAEFLDTKNGPIVGAVENLLFHDAEFRQSVPAGLELALSGTAVVGRDMLRAAKESAKATEHLTVVLVVGLLIAIYRAPLLALIPLMTVFVAVKLTMALLCLLAEQGWVTLFSGVESYVTVLLYGAGVDYCLFLIARYKEEIDQGIAWRQAIADAVRYVGSAITASAGTVICGIGMMVFAEFGKFHEAGVAISFGLVIVLVASLTFTPALLRCFGPWVFWPKIPVPGRITDGAVDGGWLQQLWDHTGAALRRRPLAIWSFSVLLLLPFAVVGAMFYNDLSYGLLSDLPQSSRSVVGTQIVQQHFSPGATGPIIVLVESDHWDFGLRGGDDGGLDQIRDFTLALKEQSANLQVTDIRSVSHPYGGDQDLDSIRSLARRKITTDRSVERYVAEATPDGRSVTRLELIAGLDPFSQDSIRHLTRLEQELPALLPPALRDQVVLRVMGPTASIRDLKLVTDRDQYRIDLLVITGVFLILVLLLRRPWLCVYLIVSVLFSYLATLGITYLAFWWWDGESFAGLDWKVPMFLFTILIAVGEDYNIFLMTRIDEEQRTYGPEGGIVHALSRTGRIISSCGIIMAGTFLSLATGYLKGMSQLGFALAVGVLIDTFVVRPILVPAFLLYVAQLRAPRAGETIATAPVAAGIPDQDAISDSAVMSDPAIVSDQPAVPGQTVAPSV